MPKVRRLKYLALDGSTMGFLGLCGATATDECSDPLDVIMLPGKCLEAVYLARFD